MTKNTTEDHGSCCWARTVGCETGAVKGDGTGLVDARGIACESIRNRRRRDGRQRLSRLKS